MYPGCLATNCLKERRQDGSFFILDKGASHQMTYDREKNEFDIRMVVGIQDNIKIINNSIIFNKIPADAIKPEGLNNKILQCDILDSLRNIGIAVSYLTHNCKIYDRTIPWKSWIGLSRRIMWKSEIDIGIIKDTVANDIPILETFCTKYLEANAELVQGLLDEDNDDNLGWILKRIIWDELHRFGVVEDDYYTMLNKLSSNSISTPTERNESKSTENEYEKQCGDHNGCILRGYAKTLECKDFKFPPSHELNIQDIELLIGVQHCIRLITKIIEIPWLMEFVKAFDLNDEAITDIGITDISLTTIRNIMFASLRNIGIALLGLPCEGYDPTIPWDAWVRLYYKIMKDKKIDLELAWDIATNDVPVLKKFCEKYLEEHAEFVQNERGHTDYDRWCFYHMIQRIVKDDLDIEDDLGIYNLSDEYDLGITYTILISNIIWE